MTTIRDREIEIRARLDVASAIIDRFDLEEVEDQRPDIAIDIAIANALIAIGRRLGLPND